MKLYIDSDSLLYRSAHLNSHRDDALTEALALDDDGDDLGLEEADSRNTLNSMRATFDSMVNEIVVAVRMEYPDIDLEPILVLTVKGSLGVCDQLEDNFRYKIMSEVADPAVKGYKANRSGMEVPEGLNDIYIDVFNRDNCICESAVEADDVVVRKGLEGHIVAALDKDVIGSLPIAYNFGKREWVTHTEREVNLFPFIQTITGDTSDGLRGVYRVGIKGAEKALAEVQTPYEAWREVVKLYVSKGQTIEEAIATYRCVAMTQWTEEHGLKLWTPPTKETTWEQNNG